MWSLRQKTIRCQPEQTPQPHKTWNSTISFTVLSFLLINHVKKVERNTTIYASAKEEQTEFRKLRKILCKVNQNLCNLATTRRSKKRKWKGHRNHDQMTWKKKDVRQYGHRAHMNTETRSGREAKRQNVRKIWSLAPFSALPPNKTEELVISKGSAYQQPVPPGETTRKPKKSQKSQETKIKRGSKIKAIIMRAVKRCARFLKTFHKF